MEMRLDVDVPEHRPARIATARPLAPSGLIRGPSAPRSSSENLNSPPRLLLPVRAHDVPEPAAHTEWDQYRQQIIKLYWDHDLTINQVQDYMRRERGFDKSIKAYKGRLKKWGIRKNIKKEEAVQLASGRAVSKFWPDTRGEAYLRRVARHTNMPGRRREPTLSPWRQAGAARENPPIPAQIYIRGVVEAIESALFYGDVFLQGMHRPSTVTLISTPSIQRDERFFELFGQAIEDIAQNRQSHLAFANLNAAFDHLKGLLLADHPVVFYRLADQILSCRDYPNSDLARKVCRLLAVHVLQLARVVMGPGHPINNWWSTSIKLIDSGQWDHVVKFLDSAQRLGSKYIAYEPETVDLITYVASDMRGQKEDILREKIIDLAQDTRRVSEAQEARLCLSELLLGQGEIEQGLQLLREALAFKDLDPDRPASKAFWLSELFWRAGALDESLDILHEANELIKGGGHSRSGAKELVKGKGYAGSEAKELIKRDDHAGSEAVSAEEEEAQTSQPREGLLLTREALEGSGLDETFLLSLILPEVYRTRLRQGSKAMKGS